MNVLPFTLRSMHYRIKFSNNCIKSTLSKGVETILLGLRIKSSFLKDSYFFFLFCHFSIVTKSGEPMNIDEYVPAAIPIRRARANLCVASPPYI